MLGMYVCVGVHITPQTNRKHITTGVMKDRIDTMVAYLDTLQSEGCRNAWSADLHRQKYNDRLYFCAWAIVVKQRLMS
jgi:hypothetical protein